MSEEESEYISTHCANNHHKVCMVVYPNKGLGMRRCKCICHVSLAKRRGWKDEK